jgi:hypothetical protein
MIRVVLIYLMVILFQLPARAQYVQGFRSRTPVTPHAGGFSAAGYPGFQPLPKIQESIPDPILDPTTLVPVGPPKRAEKKISALVASPKKGRDLIDAIHSVTKDQGHYNYQRTTPGSPAQKKFGDAVQGADPPGANACPGCGKNYKNNCDCGFKFNWDNSPEQWRSMFKFCPTCKSTVQFTNGCVQCTVCPFLMVIDKSQFEYKSMRNTETMYIPKPHEWQIRESQQNLTRRKYE